MDMLKSTLPRRCLVGLQRDTPSPAEVSGEEWDEENANQEKLAIRYQERAKSRAHQNSTLAISKE